MGGLQEGLQATKTRVPSGNDRSKFIPLDRSGKISGTILRAKRYAARIGQSGYGRMTPKSAKLQIPSPT